MSQPVLHFRSSIQALAAAWLTAVVFLWPVRARAEDTAAPPAAAPPAVLPKEAEAESLAGQGQWSEAAARMDEARDAYAAAGDRAGTLRTRVRAGQYLFKARRAMESFSLLFDALADLESLGLAALADEAWLGLVQAAEKIGKDKDVAGEFHLLQQVLDRVPESDRSLRGRIRLHRIGRYRDLGWDDKLFPELDALLEFNRTATPPDAAGEGRALTRRGSERCRARKVDEGLADFAAAAEILRKIGDLEGLAETLTGAGLARLTQKGDPEKALPMLREASDLFGRCRHRAGQVQAMEGWEDALKQKNEIAEAARLAAMRAEVQARGRAETPTAAELTLVAPPGWVESLKPGDPWCEIAWRDGRLTARLCRDGSAEASAAVQEAPLAVRINGVALDCAGRWVRRGERRVFLGEGDSAMLTRGGDLRLLPHRDGGSPPK